MPVQGAHLLGQVEALVALARGRDDPTAARAGGPSRRRAPLSCRRRLVDMHRDACPGRANARPLTHLDKQAARWPVELRHGASDIREPLGRGAHEERVLGADDGPIRSREWE